MSAPPLLNAAGRRRSPVTLPGYLAGRPPRNKGLRYPPDPPTVEEIVAVMRQAGATPHGLRMGGLIVVPWRAGLRIHEALALTEADLDGWALSRGTRALGELLVKFRERYPGPVLTTNFDPLLSVAVERTSSVVTCDSRTD